MSSFFMIASQQRLLSPVLLLWFVAGIGNGSGTVFYESLLQERVPDQTVPAPALVDPAEAR